MDSSVNRGGVLHPRARLHLYGDGNRRQQFNCPHYINDVSAFYMIDNLHHEPN